MTAQEAELLGLSLSQMPVTRKQLEQLPKESLTEDFSVIIRNHLPLPQPKENEI